jgi:3'-phosphoadenosine 5'-phosphosulfate sulfotransferase
MNKSIVGDIINFRGMLYAPVNEAGVAILFGKMSEDLNIRIEEMNTGYPDCIARRRIGQGWERIAIELEYMSKNFFLHQHNPNQCDLIVCWENNWKESPIEVLELKSETRLSGLSISR